MIGEDRESRFTILLGGALSTKINTGPRATGASYVQLERKRNLWARDDNSDQGRDKMRDSSLASAI
jgi:hypothetical protein